MSTKLTTTTSAALEARGAQTFLRHKVVVGIPVITFTSLMLWTAPLIGGVFGLLQAGVVGGLVGLGTGVAGSVVALSRIVLLGNQRLRRQLANRLGLGDTNAHFVGICETKNNRAVAMRLDTDDNVGFLRWTKTHLSVMTEGSMLVLAQDDIYGFEIEPVAALPYLPWIRVTYDRPSGREDFLLMSREAKSMMEQKKATLDLYATLVEWHADRQLEWLQERRPDEAQPAEIAAESEAE